MAVVTTSVLDQSFQERLQAEFIIAMRRNYVYSQGAFVWTPPGGVIGIGNRASSIVIPIYGELAPAVTALSQTADITPVTMYDNTIKVSPDLYGNAVQLSQKVQLISVPEVLRVAAQEVAMNAAESRDYLARSQAIGGTIMGYAGDASSRDACSTASTADKIAMSNFMDAVAFLDGTRAPKLPGEGAGIAAIMRKTVLLDVLVDSNIVLVAEYGAQTPSGAPSLLTGEVGTHVSGVRIIESNNAKVFHGAGAAGPMGMDSTHGLSSAVNAGDTSGFTITTATSSQAVGQYLCVGTAESTGNGENKVAETIRLTGSTGTTPSFLGGDPVGGFIYAHSSGEGVYSNQQVHTITFLGANALMMCYTNDDGLGPDGVIYPPEETGILKQFTNLGWKGFWGFARPSEGRLYRVECVVSRPVIGK